MKAWFVPGGLTLAWTVTCALSPPPEPEVYELRYRLERGEAISWKVEIDLTRTATLTSGEQRATTTVREQFDCTVRCEVQRVDKEGNTPLRLTVEKAAVQVTETDAEGRSREIRYDDEGVTTTTPEGVVTRTWEEVAASRDKVAFDIPKAKKAALTVAINSCGVLRPFEVPEEASLLYRLVLHSPLVVFPDPMIVVDSEWNWRYTFEPTLKVGGRKKSLKFSCEGQYGLDAVKKVGRRQAVLIAVKDVREVPEGVEGASGMQTLSGKATMERSSGRLISFEGVLTQREEAADRRTTVVREAEGKVTIRLVE